MPVARARRRGPGTAFPATLLVLGVMMMLAAGGAAALIVLRKVPAFADPAGSGASAPVADLSTVLLPLPSGAAVRTAPGALNGPINGQQASEFYEDAAAGVRQLQTRGFRDGTGAEFGLPDGSRVGIALLRFDSAKNAAGFATSDILANEQGEPVKGIPGSRLITQTAGVTILELVYAKGDIAVVVTVLAPAAKRELVLQLGQDQYSRLP